MLRDWWFEYWWILASLAYCVLLGGTVVVLNRRGTWPRTGPKIILAINCVIILCIPVMDEPLNYVTAAVIVLSLLMLFRTVFMSESSSKPVDR